MNRFFLCFCTCLILLWTLVTAANGYAATAFVNSSGASNDASGTSLALPAVSHTTGNFLVVLVKYEGTATTVSVSDTAGNSYTGLTQYNHTNGDLHVRIFYAKKITGHASNVVTVTWSAGRTFRKAAVQQYSGVDTTTPFDKENSGQGNSGTSMSTGNVTTTYANELFVAIAGEYNTQSNYTAGTGWTRRVDFAVDYGSGGGATEDRFVSSTGTYNATMTQPNSAEWLMAIATFKATAGLVGWWKLDDNSGATAADSSGNGNSALLVDNASWTSSARSGNAISLDGSGDYLSVTDPGAGSIFDIDTGGSVTLACWIYSGNTFASYIGLISKGDSNYGIELESGSSGTARGLDFFFYSGGWIEYHTASTVVPVDQWTHVVAVHTFGDAASTKIYVNGRPVSASWTVGTGNEAPALSDNALTIGLDGGGQYFDGYIDDVRVYNRLLTAAEVRKIYEGSNALHWSLD